MNLTTKRNAIMNAIASGGLTNLIPNNLTWQSGYFASNGTISGAGATTKEKYEEEYIEVDTTKRYITYIEYGSTQNVWCGIAQYDNSENFVSRIAPNFEYSWTVANQTMYLQRFAQPKIRISLRTYGDCKVALFDIEEVLDLMSNSGCIQLGE